MSLLGKQSSVPIVTLRFLQISRKRKRRRKRKRKKREKKRRRRKAVAPMR